MQARAQGQFPGLQIHVPGLVSLGKDASEQKVYFPCNLLMDRDSLFFLGCPAAPFLLHRAKGANLLVDATNCWPRCCQRWNSATSRWALRRAAGVAKLSFIVFPFTLRLRRNCGSCPDRWAWHSGRWVFRRPHAGGDGSGSKIAQTEELLP